MLITSLLFAKDYFNELAGLIKVSLMFDEEMPTNEEKFLNKNSWVSWWSQRARQNSQQSRRQKRPRCSCTWTTKASSSKWYQWEERPRGWDAADSGFDIRKLKQSVMHNYTIISDTALTEAGKGQCQRWAFLEQVYPKVSKKASPGWGTDVGRLHTWGSGPAQHAGWLLDCPRMTCVMGRIVD